MTVNFSSSSAVRRSSNAVPNLLLVKINFIGNLHGLAIAVVSPFFISFVVDFLLVYSSAVRRSFEYCSELFVGTLSATPMSHIGVANVVVSPSLCSRKHRNGFNDTHKIIMSRVV